MGIEIDFLPVGENSRSGDAIALRYRDVTSGFRVMVIDGGTKDAGERLVKHIKTYYGTDQVADVVNTHPDGDHSSGLSVVLEQLKVGRLWLHRPWLYAEDIRHLFSDGRITDSSLEQTIREALQSAHDLEEIAVARKIPISEPYQGIWIGPFVVLSPAKDWYLKELVPGFRGTPKAALDEGTPGGLLKALTAAGQWVAETMGVETLKEDGTTSAENESSVVMLAKFGDSKVMITGDAGIQALRRAEQYAASQGFSLADLSFMQVPHHGSRRNVAPSLLNKIKTDTAFVSAAKDDEQHPRRAVVNAFIRRGAKVYATKGVSLRHHRDMGSRNGWDPVTPLPFSPQVEA